MRPPACGVGRGASETHLIATRPVVTSTALPSTSRSRDRGGGAGESGRTDSQRLPNGIITRATNLPHGPKIRKKGTWCEAKFLILAFPISDTERRGEPHSFQTSKKLHVGHFRTRKGIPILAGIPFCFKMVPKAGFEPARVSPPPPQRKSSRREST